MERQRRHLTVGWLGMALIAASAAWFAVLAGLIKTTRTPRLYDLVDMYSLFVIVCLVWGFVAWRSFACSWKSYRRPNRTDGAEGTGNSGGDDGARESLRMEPMQQAPYRKGWMAALVLNGFYVAADLAFAVFLAYAFWKATRGS